MLRLTRLTDYGIVLMTRFAADPACETRNARELAAEVRLPAPVVSKVLKSLARAGLLVSQRGVKGGYRLAQAPAVITVADIIRALEGPIAITECSGELPGQCEHETFCAVRSNWQRIGDAVRVALESLTLDEMAHPIRPELVTLSRNPSRPGCEDRPRPHHP